MSYSKVISALFRTTLRCLRDGAASSSNRGAPAAVRPRTSLTNTLASCAGAAAARAGDGARSSHYLKRSTVLGSDARGTSPHGRRRTAHACSWLRTTNPFASRRRRRPSPRACSARSRPSSARVTRSSRCGSVASSPLRPVSRRPDLAAILGRRLGHPGCAAARSTLYKPRRPDYLDRLDVRADDRHHLREASRE